MADHIVTRSVMCGGQYWLALVAFVVAESRSPRGFVQKEVPLMSVAEARKSTFGYVGHFADHYDGRYGGMRLRLGYREGQPLDLVLE